MWSNLLLFAQKGDRLVTTIIEIQSDIFTVSGQVRLSTFALDLERVTVDLDRYDKIADNGLRLSLEAIRMRTDSFVYWQRRVRI